MTHEEAETLRQLIRTDPHTKWWASRTRDTVEQDIWAVKPDTGFITDNITSSFKRQAVLDMCCGIGRNVEALKLQFCTVLGYDLYDMLQHMDEDHEYHYEIITDDFKWLLDYIKTEYCVHTVYASLSFQHIHPEILYIYLKHLCEEIPQHRLMLKSRWYSDHKDGEGKPYTVLELLGEWYDTTNLVKALCDKQEGEFHYDAILLPRTAMFSGMSSVTSCINNE